MCHDVKTLDRPVSTSTQKGYKFDFRTMAVNFSDFLRNLPKKRSGSLDDLKSIFADGYLLPRSYKLQPRRTRLYLQRLRNLI